MSSSWVLASSFASVSSIDFLTLSLFFFFFFFEESVFFILFIFYFSSSISKLNATLFTLLAWLFFSFLFFSVFSSILCYSLPSTLPGQVLSFPDVSSAACPAFGHAPVTNRVRRIV